MKINSGCWYKFEDSTPVGVQILTNLYNPNQLIKEDYILTSVEYI